MDITDDMVKRKHKEFNKRVTKAMGRGSGGFGSVVQKLRQAIRNRI